MRSLKIKVDTVRDEVQFVLVNYLELLEAKNNNATKIRAHIKRQTSHATREIEPWMFNFLDVIQTVIEEAKDSSISKILWSCMIEKRYASEVAFQLKMSESTLKGFKLKAYNLIFCLAAKRGLITEEEICGIV